jgi:DNA-binding MarR family transcriptional regulator
MDVDPPQRDTAGVRHVARLSHPDADRDATPVELDARLDNVLFDVWLVSRATTALLDNAIRASGLDSDEFAVYSVLASTEHMTPTELARWMSAPPTTVSSYVKRFEGRGHVAKTPNPDDGRSYRLSLTPAGRRAHRAAGALFLPVLADVADRIGDEASETHRRLRELHRNVEAVAYARSPA